MAFSRNFLADIAQEKTLSPREKEVFLALLGDDKSRPQIAEVLHLSPSAVSTCLTGIYRKFQIAGSGPVKESRLKDYLTNRYRRWKSENSEDSSIIDSAEPSIDVLVRKVRSHCCEAILDNYSKIRLLDDTRIDVDLLYVDVYVLEKLSSKRYASKSGMLEGVKQREDYERLTLGQQQERRPGQKIVQEFPRLMVLGKPGSGKTTFLRHLAVDCSKGKFFCDRIPVLIELRSIKEGNPFNLLNQIHREFGLVEQEQTQQILNQGKAFILLDGLDEVPSQLRQSVRDKIYEFAKEYHKNRFILICRTQTTEYIANNFQPIEVADFNAEQVKIFARKWFTVIPKTSSQAEEWTKKFIRKLDKNKQIRELAVTPILLSLTCLLFTAEQDLPTKQSELYEKGIDLLLEQWDKFRDIPRDYQQLSISDKRKILSYLAFIKFDRRDNFILFEQNEIEEYVSEYLGIDVEESEAILKAIEAHHGLLIERAHGFWSFSHLTFQEYFSAKYIVDSSTPEEAFQNLVTHITEPRWREVFLLTVEMLPSADELLQLMKQKIDELLTRDEKLQRFLEWLDKKTRGIEGFHKLEGIRAFYFRIEVDDLSLEDFWEFSPEIEKHYAIEFSLDKRLSLDECIAHILDLDEHKNQCFRTVSSYKTEIKTEIEIYSECCNEPWFDERYYNGVDLLFEIHHSICEAYSYMYEIARLFEIAYKLTDQKEIMNSLQKLKHQLPVLATELDRDAERKLIEWWKTDGQIWTEQLRSVMIEHRNIGHDWQFSKKQKQLLQQYYDANKLLVDCLDSDCYVSRNVRQEIEETLLLPMSEIEKRQQGKVG